MAAGSEEETSAIGYGNSLKRKRAVSNRKKEFNLRHR